MSSSKDSLTDPLPSQQKSLIDPLISSAKSSPKRFNTSRRASDSNDSNVNHSDNSDITPNDGLGNVSTDNTTSQTIDLSNNSTPSSSSIIFKNNQRTKLSIYDVKLILYFIVQVKPFKYVGDRSLSQTKKWEIIQNKYAETKRKDPFNNEIVIPTIRTLQRQLASAIKKAKFKKQSRKNNGVNEIPADSMLLLQSITSESPLENIEAALLELNELSERLKIGKASNSPLELDKANENDLSVEGFRNSNISRNNFSANSVNTGTSDNNDTSDRSASIYYPNALSDKSNLTMQMDDTRNRIIGIPSQGGSNSNNQLVDLLRTLVKQSDRYHEEIKLQNFKILEETNNKIKEYQMRCDALIESNVRFQTEQNQINQKLIKRIIGNISNNDTKASAKNEIDTVNIAANETDEYIADNSYIMPGNGNQNGSDNSLLKSFEE